MTVRPRRAVVRPQRRHHIPAPRPTAMKHLVVCKPNGEFMRHIDPHRISEVLRSQDHFVWLDMEDPQPNDVALLREEFGFHPLAIEDAMRAHERPKVDSYDGYYFLVFYALKYDAAQQQLLTQAISLFIGKNYLVSVHHGGMPVIDETIKRWEQNQEEFGQNVGALLYALFDAIVDDYFPVVDQVAERVEDLEEQIFEHYQEESLQEIFRIKHDLLNMRRVVAPERDVLNVLIRREVPIFERGAVQYLQDVYDHLLRVTDSIDNYRDLLSSATDAFLSVQSNRLNQVVRTLTVASIVLMSVTLVAGIYGMNFDPEFSPFNMPELRWYLGYPFALGLMVAIAVGLIAFFRRIKWL